MKRILFGVLLLSTLAIADDTEDRKCSVTFTAGAAGTTASPSAGTCSWTKGSTVIMQCDQDVYFNTQTTATNVDFQVKFTSNADPYIVYLGAGKTNISVLGVTASGTCKFSSSMRRKPWQQ